MAEPITWQLLQHVQAALKLVTVERGFMTDIGLGVIALEADQLPEDAAPYTLILAGTIDVSEETATRSTLTSGADMVIEVAVPFDATAGAQLQAHRARLDVIRALLPLRKNIKDRPYGINSFELTGSSIGTAEDGASVVIAQVTARAGLTESMNPASP